MWWSVFCCPSFQKMTPTVPTTINWSQYIFSVSFGMVKAASPAPHPGCSGERARFFSSLFRKTCRCCPHHFHSCPMTQIRSLGSEKLETKSAARCRLPCWDVWAYIPKINTGRTILEHSENSMLWPWTECHHRWEKEKNMTRSPGVPAPPPGAELPLSSAASSPLCPSWPRLPQGNTPYRVG